MTVLQGFYEKYESFRNSPTAEEHSNKFLAWMLTRKEELIEREKQQIFAALREKTPMDTFCSISDGTFKADELMDHLRMVEQKYYESLKSK